jgi:hemolysin activation/secretion protein
MLAWVSGMALGAPETDSSPKLDLLEFQVEGNTVLSQMAIEEAVYPLLGPGKSVADVEKARAALEKAYHDAGYLTVYVSVPEQKVKNSVVVLKVTEGVIERTRVTGAQYTLPSRIRSEAPSTAEGAVPNFNDMQRELAAVSRAPGVHVTPTLEPGRRPGTTVLELKVSDTPPVSAWLDYNNAHSANTSDTRLAGGISYSNLFQRAQTLSLTYQTAPTNPSEGSAVSASYVVPLENYQRYLSVYAVHSTSDVTSSAVNVGDQILFGNNDIVGARYIMPLRPRGSMTHQLTLGLDYKNSRQDANGISTPLRYWTLDANYGMGLNDASGNWQLGAGTVLGLRGLGSGPQQLCRPQAQRPTLAEAAGRLVAGGQRGLAACRPGPDQQRAVFRRRGRQRAWLPAVRDGGRPGHPCQPGTARAGLDAQPVVISEECAALCIL